MVGDISSLSLYYIAIIIITQLCVVGSHKVLKADTNNKTVPFDPDP